MPTMTPPPAASAINTRVVLCDADDVRFENSAVASAKLLPDIGAGEFQRRTNIGMYNSAPADK